MSERIKVKTIIAFTTKRLFFLPMLFLSIVIINIIIGRTEFNNGLMDVAKMTAFGAPLFYIIIWDDLSHRVDYDEDAFYYRKSHLTNLGRLFRGQLYNAWQAMRFDEIARVAAESNPRFSVPGRAFQYVRLYRKNWDGEEAFWFELLRYKKESIRALVKLIHEKRPETFSKEMLDYLKANW